jgi:ArsR family transcriptional regulator
MKSRYEKDGELLKALAHPVRLRIVETLMDLGDCPLKNCTVSCIQRCLDMPQSTLSQHLAILKSRGIIEGTKDAAKTCYKVKNKTVKKIIQVLGEK